MSRRVVAIVSAFVFTAAGTAHSQATQSTEPTEEASVRAAAPSSAANPSAPRTLQKKVWTNEEVNALDRHTGISTVGRETDNTTKQVVPAKSHNAKWYQDQIAKLQAKIPPLDSQITELQSALDGKPTGDAKKSVRPYRVTSNDWSRELADLQKERDDALAQIRELQDQARHNGVTP